MLWARRAGPLLGAAENGRGPGAKPVALLGWWMDIWSIYLSLSTTNQNHLYIRLGFFPKSKIIKEVVRVSFLTLALFKSSLPSCLNKDRPIMERNTPKIPSSPNP